MHDAYNLQRFVDAQGDGMAGVLEELRQGRKRSHWMWYVFPQVQGLGRSPTSERYAIRSREEAQAYLQHPLLGPRLLECTETVNVHEDRTAEQIFGYPDHLKFHSSMTLFREIADANSPFSKALAIFFAGEPDSQTLAILQVQSRCGR